jgi:alpha-tubulin suppressor-like RCC1 family protein
VDEQVITLKLAIRLISTLLAIAVPVSAQIPSTAPPPPIAFQSMSLGQDFTCGLDGSGTAFCWGANYHGQLGVTPTYTPAWCDLPMQARFGCALFPVEASTAEHFTQLAAGLSHICGISTTKAVWCWGFNADGQLGTDAEVGQCKPQRGEMSAGTGEYLPGPCSHTPHRVELDSAVREVAAGDKLTCALTENGAILCWGKGLGATPTRIDDGEGFEDIGSLAGGSCTACRRSPSNRPGSCHRNGSRRWACHRRPAHSASRATCTAGASTRLAR